MWPFPLLSTKEASEFQSQGSVFTPPPHLPISLSACVRAHTHISSTALSSPLLLRWGLVGLDSDFCLPLGVRKELERTLSTSYDPDHMSLTSSVLSASLALHLLPHPLLPLPQLLSLGLKYLPICPCGELG